MANITVEEVRRLLITKSITHSNNMDLSGLRFSGLTLAAANFSGRRLIKTKFVKTFLSIYNF